MQDIIMDSISWVSMQHASCNHDRLEHALEIKMGYMYCILIIHAVISNNFFCYITKMIHLDFCGLEVILEDLHANCKYITIYSTHNPYFVGLTASKYGKANGS